MPCKAIKSSTLSLGKIYCVIKMMKQLELVIKNIEGNIDIETDHEIQQTLYKVECINVMHA